MSRAGECWSGSTSTSRWRTGGSPTTPASGRRCRRSSCCASAARRWFWSPTWGGRRASPTRRSRWRAVGERLAQLLDAEVHQAPAVIGERGRERWPAALGPGEVLLLENVRFEPGEKENDPALAEALARRSPTSTSTTPSASPTAPTPAPPGWRASCRATPACCSSARWRS